MTQKLSILIPVFNEEKTIAQCIAGVKKAKLPVGWAKEIIVIDDGSFDSTSKIIKKINQINLMEGNKMITRENSLYGNMKWKLTIMLANNGKSIYWFKTEKEAQYRLDKLINSDKDKFFQFYK